MFFVDSYFIGTENSNYFGTTFWTIPVAYPSAAVDLIDLMFNITNDGYAYKIHFIQTKKPYNDQNKYALQLILNIKPQIKNTFSRFNNIRPNGDMEYYVFNSPKENYKTIEDLIKDAEADLQKLFPIVDKGIQEIKKTNPKFEANRITKEDFQILLDKFGNRKNKYAEVYIIFTSC